MVDSSCQQLALFHPLVLVRSLAFLGEGEDALERPEIGIETEAGLSVRTSLRSFSKEEEPRHVNHQLIVRSSCRGEETKTRASLILSPPLPLALLSLSLLRSKKRSGSVTALLLFFVFYLKN